MHDYAKVALRALAVALAAPVMLMLAIVWTCVGCVCRISVAVSAWLCWVASIVLLVGAATTSNVDVVHITLLTVELAVFAIWSYVATQMSMACRREKVIVASPFIATVILLGALAITSPKAKPFSIYLGLLLLEVWSMTSWYQLEDVERRMIDTYCKRRVLRRTIATLGTWAVLDDGDELVQHPIVERKLCSGSKFASEHDSLQPLSESSIQRATSKPILVLVHGWAAGNAYFMLNLDALAAHFHVYAVELLGCGRSTRVPWRYFRSHDALEAMSLALEQWASEVGIEHMILLGHSLGCLVVSAYAAKHPSRIDRLLLTSPAGAGTTPIRPMGTWKSDIEAFIWNCTITPMDFIRWAGPFGIYVSKYYGAGRALRSPENSSFRKIDMKLFSEYSFHNFALRGSGERALSALLYSHGGGKTPLSELLDISSNQFRGHVSIIYGDERLDWMKRGDGLALHQQLNKQGISCDFFEVPEAGHMLFLDNTVEFNRYVIAICNDTLEDVKPLNVVVEIDQNSSATCVTSDRAKNCNIVSPASDV